MEADAETGQVALDFVSAALDAALPEEARPAELFADASQAFSKASGAQSTGLSPVAPNPSAGNATVRLTVSGEAEVVVEVLDALGRRVGSHAARAYSAGTHRLTLPTKALPSGVYVVRVRVRGAAESSAHAQRFVLAR